MCETDGHFQASATNVGSRKRSFNTSGEPQDERDSEKRPRITLNDEMEIDSPPLDTRSQEFTGSGSWRSTSASTVCPIVLNAEEASYSGSSTPSISEYYTSTSFEDSPHELGIELKTGSKSPWERDPSKLLPLVPAGLLGTKPAVCHVPMSIDEIPDAVCLGMISAKIIDRSKQRVLKRPILPIRMTTKSNSTTLRSSSGEYIGLMESSLCMELQLLRQQYLFHAEAFVVNAQAKEVTDLRRKIDGALVYVVIYGSSTTGDEIGWYLSDRQLYLQHPLTYDISVPYINPHYFIPPGHVLELPKIIALSLDDKSGNLELLDDALQIFENNIGVNEFQHLELGPIRGLRTMLKEHQKVAVEFMLEKEEGKLEGNRFECLWQTSRRAGVTRYLNKVTGVEQSNKPLLPRSGLLADSMGLGKSLAALTLVATDSSSASGSPTLIVTPHSTLASWSEQINRHFEDKTFRWYIYHKNQRERKVEKLLSYNIVLTTYHTIVAEYTSRGRKKGGILQVPWRRVILDEAHSIKDRSTKSFKAACSLQSERRWCLTGTPIQNRIDDFASLLGFLQYHPFDSDFKKLVVDPLKSTSPKAIARLQLLVQSVSLRRTKTSLGATLQLPTRTDHIEFIEFSEEERARYEFARKNASLLLQLPGNTGRGGGKYQGILKAILRLRQFCNHNCDLWSPKYKKFFQESFQNLDQPGGAFFDELDSCEACGGEVYGGLGDGVDSTCLHVLCYTCMTGAKVNQSQGGKRSPGKNASSGCPLCLTGTLDVNEQEAGGRSSSLRRLTAETVKPSSKVKALVENLQKDTHLQNTSRPKSVVFSCWTTMLDLVEIALNNHSIQFKRIDGSMSLDSRSSALQTFRDNAQCQVLLATIQCAGVGIDLSIASRVHLLEPQWNPSTEEQALDRVHRMGQNSSVETYRYIVSRSIDEYVRALQEKKIRLVKLSFSGESSLSGGLKNLEPLLR